MLFLHCLPLFFLFRAVCRHCSGFGSENCIHPVLSLPQSNGTLVDRVWRAACALAINLTLGFRWTWKSPMGIYVPPTPGSAPPSPSSLTHGCPSRTTEPSPSQTPLHSEPSRSVFVCVCLCKCVFVGVWQVPATGPVHLETGPVRQAFLVGDC